MTNNFGREFCGFRVVQTDKFDKLLSECWCNFEEFGWCKRFYQFLYIICTEWDIDWRNT